MDDRKLTLIVVPHGDLETKTFEIGYWKLKLWLGLGVALLLVGGFVLATWFPIAAQATRVAALEAELEALTAEREQVAELAEALAEVEAQYERVRELLGTEGREGVPVLPPLRRDTARSGRGGGGASVGAPGAGGAASDSLVPATLTVWPLRDRGFVTRAQTAGARGHPGLDIAAPLNSVIRASGAGVVREVRFDPVYGNFTRIDHGEGLESLYGHASHIIVQVGATVSPGQVIGYSGSTGQSSGPHLHFEVRKDGLPVDPLRYVKQP